MIKKADNDFLLYQYGKLNNKLGRFHRLPVGYFFYITDLCNLTCDYCWQRADGSVPNAAPELSLEEWIKVVKKLPRFSFVGLTGGEATAFKGINELVKLIKFHRHPLTLNTNGMLLNEERLRVFVECGMDNISISIDGFAEYFDKARQHEGLFDRIVSNISVLNRVKKELGKKKPTLTIKTVLLDEAVDDLERFYDYCADELLADNINISFMKTLGHAQFDTRILHEWEQVVAKGRPVMYSYHNREKIVQTLLKLFDKSQHKKCAVSLYPKMKTEKEIRRLIDSEGVNVYQSCYIPWALSVISPAGDVIPCLSLSMGNVRDYDYDIKKCYSSQEYNKFLKWLDNVNKSGKTAPVCNMCCFLEVEGN